MRAVIMEVVIGKLAKGAVARRRERIPSNTGGMDGYSFIGERR